MSSAVPFPEDDYVRALGRLCYAVSYLEWSVLGDLPRVPGLPAELRLSELAGKTTGQIGGSLKRHLARVPDPAVRGWLEAAGDHLVAVAKLRNSVLHARPATVQSHQRLHRWDPSRGETLTITDAHLAKLLQDIDGRIRDMSGRRIISLK
jgi:hypothetical protein